MRARASRQLHAVSGWIETHPRGAWLLAALLVLMLVGWEANFWPSHHFPNALWHQTPRGDDIELAQANAAKAGWPELWGYWTGPMIHGHGYYRPLTSWLFVAQYRLFGTADGKWALVNIALHLGLCLLLLWATGALLGGSRSVRLASGVAAALLVGAPVLADRSVQFWILGWWPCQSEILSLLAGLTLLGATAEYARTGKRRWLALGIPVFVLGILCKEMTYVAGLGACALLVRCPQRRRAILAIALPAILLFAVRKWAVRHVAVEGGIPLDRVFLAVAHEARNRWDALCGAWLHLVLPLAGFGITRLLLRKAPWQQQLVLGLVCYVAAGIVLLGPPWEGSGWTGAREIALALAVLAVLFGLGWSVRKWPTLELIGVWLLCQLPAFGFFPIFGWYRYWSSVFGAVLLVASARGWQMAWDSYRSRQAVSPTLHASQ